MNRTFYLILFLILTNISILRSQENFTETDIKNIGISFSFPGQNDFFSFDSRIGSPAYYGEGFYGVGLGYTYSFNRWLAVETGIEYSKHTIRIEPNLPPDMDNSPEKTHISVFTIPIALRFDFLKYFFLNTGIILDLDSSLSKRVDSQTGLGVMTGIYLKYDFKNGLTPYAGTYSKTHALIALSGDRFYKRIWETGIRAGLCYDLAKLYK